MASFFGKNLKALFKDSVRIMSPPCKVLGYLILGYLTCQLHKNRQKRQVSVLENL
jgi:hypothetical protein